MLAGDRDIQVGRQPLLAGQNCEGAQAVVPHIAGRQQFGVADAEGCGFLGVRNRLGDRGFGAEFGPLFGRNGREIPRLHAEHEGQRGAERRRFAGRPQRQGRQRGAQRIDGPGQHHGGDEVEHPPA